MKPGKMNIMILFGILNAYQGIFARDTRNLSEKSREQTLTTYEPVYQTSNVSVIPSLVQSSVQTSSQTTYATVTSESTTEKNIDAKHEGNDTSTAVAVPQESGWFSSGILSNIALAYKKMITYTGPYLLPGLLTTVLIKGSIYLICKYSSACDGILSVLRHNTNQARGYIRELASPYIPAEYLDMLTGIVDDAVDKFSNAQNEKID